MKSVLHVAGALLCTCGILTAQTPAPNPVGSREKVIPISGGCMPEGFREWRFWKSRQGPQITVNWRNMPLSGASVEVYRGVGPYGEQRKGKPLLILKSDASGHVVLPRLPRGRYYVRGRSKPDREDAFSLEISPLGRNWPDLVLSLNPVRNGAEWVFDSLGAVPRDEPQIPALRGVVDDLIGTPAPNAEIDVFARALGISQEPIHLRADTGGKFSATLPEGEYAVVIEKDWSESMFWVNISRSAATAGLRVKLCPVVID